MDQNRRSLLQNNEIRIGRLSFRTVDLLAFLVFIAAGFFFFVTAAYGITEADESCYFSVPHRLMLGDKLFTDECHSTDLMAVFWYLPYRVFYAVLGGSEGIILALRFLYTAIKLLMFAVIYLSFRDRGYRAVLAAVMYAGTVAFDLKTITYYSVCANAVMLAGLILFVKKEARPWQVRAAGFLFACAVLAEPFAVFVWVAYTLLVLIRSIGKRKGRDVLGAYAFILDGKTWLRLMTGICAAAAVFLFLCAAFFTGTDLAAIMRGIRQLLSYSEYSPYATSFVKVRFDKLMTYIQVYRAPLFIPFLVLWIAAHIARRYRKKTAFFFVTLMGVLYICCSVSMFFFPVVEKKASIGENVAHLLVFVMFSWTLYLFTENKNRKIGAFLLFSMAVSLCADISSICALGAVLMPGSVCSVILFSEYCSEHRIHCRERRNVANRFVSAVLAAACIFTPVYEAAHYGYIAWHQEAERINLGSVDPLNAVVAEGPYKGIHTVEQLAQALEAAERDMQTAGRLCENRVYVYGFAPSLYLSVDRKPATHCFFAYITDQVTQTEYWWQMYPEKRPDVIYIPLIDLSTMMHSDLSAQEKLRVLSQKAVYDVTKGEIGYIVKIRSWR